MRSSPKQSLQVFLQLHKGHRANSRGAYFLC
jgi:hypothetical protein